MKFFTTAGPVKPDKHYCVPLSTRLNEHEWHQLIEQEKYFVLHAPRQTGKTSVILNIAKQLNEEGTYTALYVNIEGAQAAKNDLIIGLSAVLEEFLTRLKNQLPEEKHIIAYIANILETKNRTGATLRNVLSEWASHSPKPLVLFIDEIDALIGDTLLSVLRQLRSGYDERPDKFPQSICLIGVRDVRDYRIWSSDTQQIVIGGSAFNIKAESILLRNFTKTQVHDLYTQHTTETGQQFTEDAIEYAFEVTQGQPWLVNALAYQACFRDVTDRTQAITKETIERAKETLILRRDSHLTTLTSRLHEPRVKTIVDTIIAGIDKPQTWPTGDVQYTINLGLVAIRHNTLVIANQIYQEVLSQALANATQLTIAEQQMGPRACN